jgi:hypothetical protein
VSVHGRQSVGSIVDVAAHRSFEKTDIMGNKGLRIGSVQLLNLRQKYRRRWCQRTTKWSTIAVARRWHEETNSNDDKPVFAGFFAHAWYLMSEIDHL